MAITAESETTKDMPPVEAEPWYWNAWERGAPLVAILISSFALWCSYQEAELAVRTSEAEASQVQRKLAIYDVLATRKKKGDPPLEFDALRSEFDERIAQFGGSNDATTEEFSSALLQLMESKVVIGRGDSTYTLLSEEHFVQPMDPNVKRMMGLFGDAFDMVEANSEGKSLFEALLGSYEDSEPNGAYAFEPTPYEKQEHIKEASTRVVADHETGITREQLYDELRSNEVVVEKRFSADSNFLQAVNALVNMELIKERDGTLLPIDAVDPAAEGESAPRPPVE